jgi:hypothetical protein
LNRRPIIAAQVHQRDHHVILGELILTRRDRKPPRRERRRTAETIVRTRVAVITSPDNQGTTLSLKHEVDLVKAALLYADTVEVLSLGNQMVRDVNTFAAGDSTNLYALLASLDDSTLLHLDPNVRDVDQWRQLVPMLMTLDPDALRSVAAGDPELSELAEFADLLDTGRDTLESTMAEMRAVAERMRVESGLAELEPAFKRQLVRFNDKIIIDEDMDAVIAAFIAELKRYLQDPKKFVLLDADMASLARSMIDEGLVQPPQRALSNAGEAALGTGFVARLPAFTDPPMDELIDLRVDLDEPLGRYRRKVSDLRGKLQTGPFDEHIGAEIDAIWRTEVNPALSDIRQAMADHRFARELLRGVVDDLSKFVKGDIVPAGGLTLITASAFDVSTAITAGLTATSAITPTAAKAFRARLEGRAAARAHDLFYLHAVDKRLSSKGSRRRELTTLSS